MYDLKIASKHIVEASVLGNGLFGLLRTDPLQRHQVGLYSAPLYTLQQPFASDEGWLVTPNPQGEYVQSDKLGSRGLLPTWLQSKRGLDVIDMLPSGSYYIVRSGLQPTSDEYMYVGNEASLSTPNMRVLSRGRGPVDAIIVGSPQATAPNCDYPLVGVVVCNHTGMKFPTGSDEVSQHQIIFFSFGDGTVKSIAPEAVLIIPATGELVVDNLQSSTSNTQVFRAAKEDPSFRHVWQSAFARNAAEFFSRPERTDEGTVA